MNYSEYKQSSKLSSVWIEGRRFNQVQLKDWINVKTSSNYLLKIKQVYRNWFSDSLFFEVETSGSTGAPKIIRLQKDKMYNSALKSLNYFELRQGQKVLLALPAEKIGGLMLIIRAIIGNLNLYHIKPRLDPLNLWNAEEIDFCSLTPSQLFAIKEEQLSLGKLRVIKRVLLGGSDINQALSSFIQKENNDFYHSYGMTETISHVAIRKLNGMNRSAYFSALEGISFKSNDEDQLIICSDQLLNKDLVTNDIVTLIDKKTILWRGRKDNVVNSGGIKLVVEEIEDKIKQLVKLPFYLVGIPDDLLGEKLVLMIEGVNFSQSELKSLKLDFEGVLQKYEIPKDILMVSRFSYTANGKLIRTNPNQLS